MRIISKIFILIMLLQVACNKQDFFRNANAHEQLVIQAEITSGDSVYIPAGRSILVGSGNIIQFGKVNNAIVTVTDLTGSSITISQNNNTSFSDNPFSIFTNPYQFLSDKTYQLSVKNSPFETVTATTHIPAAITFAGIDTFYSLYQGNPVLTADISFRDDPSVNNNYIIEVLKQRVRVEKYFYYQNIKHILSDPADSLLYEQIKNDPGFVLFRDSIPQIFYTLQSIYTADYNTDNARLISLDNSFQRIFLPDSTFRGQTYTTRVQIARDQFIDNAIEKRGRIIIRLKSASDELYNYLLDHERYFIQFGSVPINQLTSPKGNIVNGLGVFGGSYKKEWVFYFDELL
jgi:hypothetical protein